MQMCQWHFQQMEPAVKHHKSINSQQIRRLFGVVLPRWGDCGVCHVLCQQTVETMAWLTFLTVVKLVKLTGFGLALAEDQVVSDVTIRVVGRFPL